MHYIVQCPQVPEIG